LRSWIGNAEASGVARAFGRHLRAAVQLVVVSALRHRSEMLEVERKGHVYIRTERLKEIVMWELGRNEIAREQDEIVPPDLGTVGYIISIRSPDIRTDYLHDLRYLSVSVFRLQEVPKF